MRRAHGGYVRPDRVRRKTRCCEKTKLKLQVINERRAENGKKNQDNSG